MIYLKWKKKELSRIIKSIGLYNNKSKNLILMSKNIIKNFNGKIPNNKKDLIKLEGIGNKTANIILSNIYNINCIAVDTHVFRVSNRLGLINEKKILKAEKALEVVIQKKDLIKMHYCLINHGKKYCKARSPLCNKCFLNLHCFYYKNCIKNKNI